VSENLKVLVVDDEEDLAEIICDALDESFNSSFVTCATKAFEMIESGEYDVIISDSNMPGMSGLELLDKVNSLDRKVLCYLATGDIAVTDEMIKNRGGHGVFEKPFSTRVVIGKIMKDFESIH
jgi:DNA-binding NtrC family response regulator